MSTAIFNQSVLSINGFKLNIAEIQRARQGEITQKRCVALAKKIRNLTVFIDDNWTYLETNDQEKLKDLAYYLLDTSKQTNFFRKIYINLRILYFLYQAVSNGYYEGFVSLLEAINALIDGILNAVEREKLTHFDVDFDTLDRPNTNSVINVAPGGINDWLSNLSNQALDDI